MPLDPMYQPDESLPVTVIEIRCPCRPERKNCFNIRTRQPIIRKMCHLCSATYVVHLFAGGAVKVGVIPSGQFVEQDFPHYSKVTDGE